MKIGIVGNCQATVFGWSIGAMNPAVAVQSFGPGELRKAPDREAIVARLAQCDLVFALPTEAGHAGPLRFTALSQRLPRVLAWPAIAFTGFHPDCVYVTLPDGRNLQGPLGPYHSALAAACFAEGLPPARALRLFNAYSFAALGYPGRHAEEEAHLARSFAALGYDWARARDAAPGVFMHVINHPKIALTFAVAQQAMERAGLAAAPAALPADGLAAHGSFAVYPELARHLGVPPGDFVMRRAPFGLEAMIEGSYAAFAAAASPRWPPAVQRARDFLRTAVLGLPPLPTTPPRAARARQRSG